MATKLTGSESSRLSCVGSDAGKISEAHTETQKQCRIEGSLAVDLGQLAARTNQQGSPEFQEETASLYCSWRKPFWTPALLAAKTNPRQKRSFSGPHFKERKTIDTAVNVKFWLKWGASLRKKCITLATVDGFVQNLGFLFRIEPSTNVQNFVQIFLLVAEIFKFLYQYYYYLY